MRHSRLDTVLLAGIGTLSVHEIAYVTRSSFASATGAEVAHGHIPVLWGLGGAIAVTVMVRMIVSAMRSRGNGLSVDPVLLGAAIAALYVSQEAAEVTLAGDAAISLLAEPVLWLGLAAAPVVAWLLTRLVTTVVDAIATAGSEPRMPTAALVVLRPRLAVAAAPVAALAHCLCRRGPPHLSRIRFA